MTKILVLYHSCYGHVEQMAHAQAEGARRVPGAEVIVKRVPELVSEEARARRQVQGGSAGADRGSERARPVRRHHLRHRRRASET